MSRVILCSGKTSYAKYTFPETGVSVYTIEELCYYLWRNIDILTADMLDFNLSSFIGQELGLPERGRMLEQLILKNAPLRDRLVAVFCSADYLLEPEITRALEELEMVSALSVAQKNKRRADKHLMKGQNREALHEYQSIIASAEGSGLSPVEYGNICHNIGVLKVRTGQYEAAAENFLEAYERNNNRDSLKQYLFAIKMSGKEKEYRAELARLSDSRELSDELEHEYDLAIDNCEQTGEFRELNRLRVLWQQERFSEYERLAGQMIDTLKAKYREENK